jgi:hypothetical protein
MPEADERRRVNDRVDTARCRLDGSSVTDVAIDRSPGQARTGRVPCKDDRFVAVPHHSANNGSPEVTRAASDENAHLSFPAFSYVRLSVSSSQFPVPSFQFPVSSSQSPVPREPPTPNREPRPANRESLLYAS